MSKQFKYYTCDVFTSQRFGGNQLAVVLDAERLDDATMQAIAKEFNYSETTFVLPPAAPNNTARVRIFTPGAEVPFAGHPTVGTAFVLAATGVVPASVDDIVFEEGVGPVPVSIARAGGEVRSCTLTAARLPEQGPPPPPREQLARMLQLDANEVLDGAGCWSSGLPFLVVPLANEAALAACKLDLSLWSDLLGRYATDAVYPVVRMDGSTWKVRMFGPSFGIAEDPATGAAAAAFAGWVAARTPAARIKVLQGEFMGRSSEIDLTIDRAGERVSRVRVGGAAVMVCEGMLTV
ncbi:MAG TPA: PhzF family phenazine biosynthesis protein [Burkholderiaceae bacterium]|nr:PhzF family phenazine biosynthesis protein [Burkholderiaceae bacterium]